MAGNQVTITFAGDEKDLDRSFGRVQAGAKATGDALAQAGKKAEESTRGLGHVAEATDEVDTLGSKATSSLGALSSGFQLLGPRGEGAAQGLMTAALATDALSGAGEAATLVTENFGKTIAKAKDAFGGLSSAAKLGVVSFGLVAGAAAAAGLIFLAFKAHQEKVKAEVDALSQSLNFQSAAFDKNNRAVIAQKLEERGLLELAHKAGINQQALTQAVLDGGDALDRLGLRTGFVNRNMTAQQIATVQLAQGTHDLANEVAAAQEQQGRLGRATGDSADAFADQTVQIKNAQDALKAYNQSLHDELDPSANLFHRLQDLKQAQKDYTQAVKEHGAKSPEAIAANVDLAEAVLAARDAASTAGGTFTGKFTPAMHDALIQAGYTEGQIKLLETALNKTRIAGEKLDGKTFKFTVEEVRNIHENRYARTVDVDGARASGGPVAAGKTYKVGERGVELVTFGSDGYVHDAATSAAMMAGGSNAGAAGGGSLGVTVTLDATGAASDMKQMILKWFRTDAGFRNTVKGYVGVGA